MNKFIFKMFVLLVLFFMFLLKNNTAQAASLTQAKDTITTSRPSPASPLSANGASGDSQVTIFNNGSRFLASDSATIIRTSTGATVLGPKIVASQSADLTKVYNTTTLGSAAQAGTDVFISPQTAMHSVQFTLATGIPSGGKIVMTFPGSGSSIASPSASTFSFNGLSSGNATTFISYQLVSGGAVTCGSFTVTAPTITCTTSGGALSAGQVVKFFIGCADGSSNDSSCATQSPLLVNPTKSATAGSADTWKIAINTQDASSAPLDGVTVIVGTVESVQVIAQVDASLTFTIAGVSDNTTINTLNAGCSGNTDVTNTGIASTATTANLGFLTTNISISAQNLTVTTNASGGYALTATASGHLINPSTGVWVPDSTTPTFMTAGTRFFGLHPCGLDVTTGAPNNWGSGATGGGAGAAYAWPTTATGSISTLASRSPGPIGSPTPGPTGAGITTVEYAATVDVTVPAGTYQSVVTYVATPTF